MFRMTLESSKKRLCFGFTMSSIAFILPFLPFFFFPEELPLASLPLSLPLSLPEPLPESLPEPLPEPLPLPEPEPLSLSPELEPDSASEPEPDPLLSSSLSREQKQRTVVSLGGLLTTYLTCC